MDGERQVKPRSKFFYSTTSAAKALGVSVRTIGRITTDHNIEPMKFEGHGCRLRHFWSVNDLKDIRRHLKAYLRSVTNV